MRMKQPVSKRGFMLALLVASSVTPAYAGSINSNPYSFSVQDPCAYGVQEANAPACTAALADRYKKRCVASWRAPRERCGPGECNDWLLTARTQAIVVETPALSCKKQLVFTKQILTTEGKFVTYSWCLSGTPVESMRQYPIPPGAKTYPIAVQNLAPCVADARF